MPLELMSVESTFVLTEGQHAASALSMLLLCGVYATIPSRGRSRAIACHSPRRCCMLSNVMVPTSRYGTGQN